MSVQRQFIRKTQRTSAANAESPFWPVSAALISTAALGLVAALTSLGPAGRWWSLVLIPVGLWVVVWGLRRVNNRWLKRSLQLAVLSSLSLHLLMVIVLSLTRVFGAGSPIQPKTVSSPRPARVLLTSRPTAEPIWEQVNRRAVEDPRLDTARVATLTEVQPTPLELEKPVERPEPQVAKRDTVRESGTPRFADSLSERRRSETQSETASSAQAAAAISRTSRAASAAAAAPSDRNETPARSENSQPAPAPSATASTSPAAAARPRPGVSKAADPAERKSETRVTELTTAEGASQAAVRSRSERLPVANPEPAPARSQPDARTNPVQNAAEPREAETAQRVSTPQAAPSPSQSLSQNQPTERSTPVRREATAARPSIADNSARANETRRSRIQVARPASTAIAETPSLATRPSAQTGQQPQPSSTSTTRAESGGALATSSEGFAPQVERSSGAAPTASNAERRVEAASTPSELQLLQNQSPSRSREVNSRSTASLNALAANTSSTALMAGKAQPDNESSSAPQSQQTSSTRDPQMEIAAMPGESTVDSRPVKRTGEGPLRADSGGGRPELDLTQAADESQSKTRGSSQSPRLEDAVAGITAADRTPSSRDSGTGANPVPGETASSRTSDATGDMPQPQGLSELAASPATDGRDTPNLAADGKSRGRGELMADDSDEEDEEARQQRLALRNSPRSQGVDAAATISTGRDQNADPASAEQLADSSADRATTPGRRDPGNPGLENALSGFSSMAGKENGPGQSTSAPGSSPANRDSARSARGESSSDLVSGEAQTGAGRSPTTLDSRSDASPAAIPSKGTATASTETGPSEATSDSRTGASLALEIDALPGAAGLGETPSATMGAPIRPSERESPSILLDAPSRFIREASSVANPSGSAAAPVAREAFQSRQPASSSSSPSTEAAIELGLEFLARNQQPDGSWSLEMFDTGHPSHNQQLVSGTAATGLAVLAFQGAGYHHRDYKYAAVLSRALTWLIEHQQADGNLYLPANEESNRFALMYSHGIASLALTEAWGMTQDASLRGPCEKAIAFIASSQDPQRGGWRYRPEAGQRMTDTSVTGWMLMALHSARQGGLEVPEQTLAGIERWMEVAHDPSNPSLFRYDPYAEASGSIQRVQQRNASPAMTAVGLLMRIYTGTGRDSQLVESGADYLLERLPAMRDGLTRDTYYWYYATQVLRHVGGPRWEQWHAALHPLLVESQEKTGPLAGSWDPYAPVPDRWGPFAGRLYVTTMNLLSLEVDYRLLPLYEKNTGK